MPEDSLRYDKMVETALRGVAREALSQAARDGLPGAHHFYIGFRTGAAGVAMPAPLRGKYPDEMTIVLQHQFWGLEVGADAFSVSLSFQGRPERLTVPFSAITSFADPSVNFGLQFEVSPAPPTQPVVAPTPPAARPAALPAAAAPAPPTGEEPPAARPAAEIVALDKFRKR
jgi:uncharacterized protein